MTITLSTFEPTELDENASSLKLQSSSLFITDRQTDVVLRTLHLLLEERNELATYIIAHKKFFPLTLIWKPEQ